MTFALGLFLLGLHLTFYLIANKVRLLFYMIGYSLDVVRFGLLLISVFILGISCVRSKLGVIPKAASLVSLIVLGLFVHCIPYAASYSGSRFFMERFDLWFFLFGAVLIATSLIIISRKLSNR